MSNNPASQISSQRESLVETENDRELLLQPIIGIQDRNFGKIHTICYAITYLTLILGLSGAMTTYLFVNMNCDGGRFTLRYFFYMQPVFFILTKLFERHCQKMHEQSWREGYLKFNQKINKFWRTPFLLICAESAILIIFVPIVIKMDYCNNFLIFVLLCSFNLLVILVISVIVIVYIAKIKRFNRSNALPDVMQDEWMVKFIRDSFAGEVGYRESENLDQELLERQAELIRCLLAKNRLLFKKLFLLEHNVLNQS